MPVEGRHGLRVLLREEGMSFQRLKTCKQSRDPAFEAKKNRILHLYGLMDGTVDAQPGDPMWLSAWMSSGRSTSNRTRVGSRPLPAVVGRRRGADGGPPLPARTVCGTCWPPTT